MKLQSYTLAFFILLGEYSMAQAIPKIEFIDIQKNLPVTEVLSGRAVAIKVSGLPGETLTSLTCDNGLNKSWAQFKSSESGKIDLSLQAPLSGTYSGIDVDGMFWSRSAIENLPADARPHPLVCRVFIDNKEVTSATLKKLFNLSGINGKRLTLTRDGFEGFFSTPKGSGPFPTLLLLGGSEGGLDEYSPNFYASLGYATLSIGYFALPGLPEEINQIPLEYFKIAIEWLKTQDEVDQKRMRLMGNSRGGELALLLASTYPDEFKSVIALEPSGLVWSNLQQGSKNQKSSWSFNGQEISSIPFSSITPHTENYPDGREIVSYTNVFLDSLKNSKAVEQAIIPIENFKGPLLILAGDADQIWPSCLLSEFAINQRKKFNLNKQDSYYCFADAGHTMGVPGLPLMDLTFYHPVANEFWTAGGTPAGNAKAQRVGWDAILKFLSETL